MIKDKEELSKQIELLFSKGGNVTSLEEAAKARKELADNMAKVIDQYVQCQIGLRLEQIMSAIDIQSTIRGEQPNCTLVRGFGYESMTRTE